MKNPQLQIISTELLEAYKLQIKPEALQNYQTLQDSELSIESFSFYTSVAAVFSSKIEGEDIELDSYVKHKRFGIEFLPDYTRKIDDLYDAYQFAKSSACTQENILDPHRGLTKDILPETKQESTEQVICM